MTDLALTILLQAKDTASLVVKGLGGSLKALAGGDVTGSINIAGAAIMGLGTIAVGAGVASVKAAGDFQQSMLKVQALAAPATENMKQMSDAILQMAPAVGVGPTKLAEGLYFVESAGIHGKAAIDLLRLSAEAASSGGIKDMAVVTDAATSAMNAFKDGSVTAQKAVDIFTATVSAGKMQAQDYANAVSVLASGTANGRAQWVEANAALAVFTRTGETARVASQHLGALIQYVGTQTEKMAKNAKGLGLQFDATKFSTLDLAGKMQYLHDVTGGNFAEVQKLLNGNKTLAATYQKLYDNSSSYNDILGQLKNSSGATDAAFAITSQGFNASTDRLNAAFDVLKITIGTALLPAITQILTALTPVITSMVAWLTQSHAIDTAIGTVKNTIAILVPIIAGLINGVGTVTHYFQQNHDAAVALLIPLGALGGYFVYLGVTAVVAFIAAAPAMIAGFVAGAVAAWSMAAGVIAATWPFIAIGAAIAAVVVIVILVIQHWNAIVAWFAGVWRVTWNAVSSFFVNIWNGIVSFAQSAWDAITNVFTTALNAVVTFFVNAWNGVVSFLQGVWKTIVTIFQVALRVLITIVLAPILVIIAVFTLLYQKVAFVRVAADAIVSAFRAAIAWLVAAWQNTVAWLVGAWQAIATAATIAWNAVTNAISVATKAVVQALTVAWNAVATFFAGIWKVIAGAATVAWNAIATFFAGVWKVIATAASVAWNAIATWFVGMWKVISTAIATAWNAVVNFFAGIWKTISSAMATAWNGISNFFAGIWNTYLAAPLASFGKSISSFFTGIWNGISGAFKGVINGIISGVNGFIDVLNNTKIHLPAITVAGIQVLPAVDIGFPHLGHIPLLAKGADIIGGGTVMVGDGGRPELLDLPAGARVRPLPAGAGALGGGGSGHTIHNYITIHANGADPKAIYAMVMKEMTRDLRRSGNLVTMTSGGRS